MVYHRELSVINIIYPAKLLGCSSMENSFHRLRERTFFGPEAGRGGIIGIGFSNTGYPGNYTSYVRFGELEIAPGSS
jgi:hypothetical protein